MVVRGGFEPPKLARQIYSLIPLATREPHQQFQTSQDRQDGAGTKSRTRDLLITSQLLYQLSYTGSQQRSGAYITQSAKALQPFHILFLKFLRQNNDQ